MKSQIFWFLQALLQQYVISVYIQEDRRFNFPLEISGSNIIYLDDYSFNFVQAPFYSITSENQFNLTISQSISKLYQTNLNNSSMKMGSNFHAQSNLYSNNFWVINQEQVLYKGLIKGDGELQMTQLDFTTQAGCFQINLINDEIGMFSCQDQGQIYFMILNSTSLESTKFSQDYQFPVEYQNPVIQIFNVSNKIFTFCLIYTTPNNAHIVYFTFDQNNIDLIEEQVFDGHFTSFFFLNNVNFLFLINSQHVQLVDLNQNIGIQEITNQSILNPEDLQPITQFSAFQIQNNIFRMVVLQNQIITTFLYDIELITQNALISSFILNEYDQVLQLVVTINNIYMVTDSFIIYLQCVDSIKAKGHYSLNFANYALIQPLRNIVIVQESITNNSNIFSTYLINQPQIMISKEQTKQIGQEILPVKFDFLAISQIKTEYIKYIFQIQLVSLDLKVNQIPIFFHQEMNDLILRFPEEKVFPKEEVFSGPNLTSSIKSGNPKYLYNGTTPASVGTFQMFNITYQSACILYQEESYFCTQFKNKTIIFSLGYPLKPKYTHFTYLGQTLIKCSCEASLTNLNLIMQFPISVLVQQFDFTLNLLKSASFPQDTYITSASILQDTMFIVTTDGKLTATTLSKQQLFTITDYNFKEVYTNPIDYPNYLFLDNFSDLLILAINGKESYEIINRITYPIQNHTSNVAAGILKGGIYLAFKNKSQSFLYFYPKINIFIQNNISYYFQVYLEKYQIYQNEKILSTFSSNNFYLILKLGQYYHISQFQASGSSYLALRITKQMRLPDYYFPLNFSCIFLKNIEYDVEIVYVFTNFHVTITRPFLSYDFILTTHYSQFDLDQKLYVRYKVSNQNYTNYIFQNVTIVYDRNFLIARKYNRDFHLKQNYSIQDQGQIKINPQHLFYGNIQNYTATCNACKSFNFSQPIDLKRSFNLKFGFELMLNYQDLIYIKDINVGFYQLNLKTNELINLFNLSNKNEVCNKIFVEIVTEFPVLVCYFNQMVVYAFNTTSHKKITYYSQLFEHYYSSDYKNGILQVFDSSLTQKLNYNAFYFWISDNQINLMQFYQKNTVCQSCYIKPVYLNMSSNYTSQPCQIFGFITTLQNGYDDNEIGLLKNCIPSNISEIFGFTPNKTTPEGNIYYKSQNWILKQRMAVAWPFQQATIQFGSAKYITKTTIEAKFIVSLPDTVDLYLILFNSTDGEIISFERDQGFYLACNYSVSGYFTFEGADDMLLIFNYQASHYQTPQIYSYENRKNMIHFNYKKINGIVGYEHFLIKPTNQYLSNNYYIIGNNTSSTIFYIQNYLKLSVDLLGIQNAKIDITSYNPSKSVTQSIYLFNQNFNNYTNQTIDDIDIPDDDTNLPDDNTNIPEDDTNLPDDNTNIPEDDTNIPEDDTNIPEDNTNIPEDDTNIPEDNTNIPEDDTNIPEDDPDITGNITEELLEEIIEDLDEINQHADDESPPSEDVDISIDDPNTINDFPNSTETNDQFPVIIIILGCLAVLIIIIFIGVKIHSKFNKKEKVPQFHFELIKK